MVKKIALEEHFLCPDFIEYWDPTVAGMPAAKRENLLNRNTDFGEMRLASMDKAGISRAVLALAGPGVQALQDEVAIDSAEPVVEQSKVGGNGLGHRMPHQGSECRTALG